jgi:Acetyltransferase (GNAT) domain
MYYWGGASWRKYQIMRPNEPLMWHAMTYWKARGIKRFDMLGAGRERDAYKKRYGAVMVPSGTQVMSSKYAWLTPLRNIAQGIFALRQTVSGRFKPAVRRRIMAPGTAPVR